MKKSFVPFVLLALASLVIGAFVYNQAMQPKPLGALEASTLYPIPKRPGHFALTQLDGKDHQVFDEKSLAGNWHLFFMGFTNCPHICPTEMLKLKQLYQQLPETLKNNMQVVMVTTDPLRDSLEVVDAYAKKYHADFIGLGGTKKQIAGFAREFALPFIPSAETDKTKQYDVDHSATIFLTNPNGDIFAFFRAPHEVDKMLADLVKMMTH